MYFLQRTNSKLAAIEFTQGEGSISAEYLKGLRAVVSIFKNLLVRPISFYL
jgi:hypothetical protein